MAWGFFKKLVIADNLTSIVDPVFANPQNFSALSLAVAVLAFTIQIYCDFSGYTDIATGVARMMGIRLSLNFNNPYFANSITNFWRRWHISLGAWFRDYVYIPLGGSRNGTAKTRINLFLVFLITGIWHGSSLNFLVWGAFYGVLSVVERIWLVSWLNSFLRVVAIYLLTLVGWDIFRSNDLASVGQYLSSMVDVRRIAAVPINHYLTNSSIIALVAGLVITFVGEPLVARVTDISTNPILKKLNKVGVLLLFCACLYLMSAATSSPFLYFRF
jgi:alginate O-acetyltransferase complex protein AlgI